MPRVTAEGGDGLALFEGGGDSFDFHRTDNLCAVQVILEQPIQSANGRFSGLVVDLACRAFRSPATEVRKLQGDGDLRAGGRS